MIRRAPRSALFPYATLFRAAGIEGAIGNGHAGGDRHRVLQRPVTPGSLKAHVPEALFSVCGAALDVMRATRSAGRPGEGDGALVYHEGPAGIVPVVDHPDVQ